MVLCGSSKLRSRAKACQPERGEATNVPSEVGKDPSVKERRNFRIAESLHFPMECMRIPYFRSLSMMTSNGALKEIGEIVEPAAGDTVHLASHQWLSFAHPDPEGVQLERLQDIFETIAVGQAKRLFGKDDWDSLTQQGHYGKGEAFRPAEAVGKLLSSAGLLKYDVCRGLLWFDYASVPQLCDADGNAELAREVAARQQSAIWSIPRYVERADYFWVLTPDAVHRDTGQVCNFNTWRSRGWCRMEEWSNALAENRKMPLIITSEDIVRTVGHMDFFSSLIGCADKAVGRGTFSCCAMEHRLADGTPIPCDKDELAKVLSDLYGSRLRLLESNKPMYCVHLLIGDVFSAGTCLEPTPPSPEDDPDDFASGIGFRGLDDMWPLNIHPLLLMATLAHPEVVIEAARRRPDLVSKPNSIGLTALMGAAQRKDQRIQDILAAEVGFELPEVLNAAMPTGITALHVAVRSGFAEAADALLQRRANIEAVRKDSGRTPLLVAAANGYPACVDTLLRHRADLNQEDSRGYTALGLAEQSLTLEGNADNESKQRIVDLLVN